LNRFKVWFRWNNKNSYSIAALLPLINADLAHKPMPGIMLYSFATAQAEEIYVEVSRARVAKVEAIFIAGGPHPSAMPEEVLDHFDFVVIGEGEETLPELIETIENGRDPACVLGIAYKRSGVVRFTEKRPPVDLDKYLPSPIFWRPSKFRAAAPGAALTARRRVFSALACATDRSRSSHNLPAATRIFASHPPIPWPMAQMAESRGWKRLNYC